MAQASEELPRCGDVDLSLVLNGKRGATICCASFVTAACSHLSLLHTGISKIGYDPGEAFWARARDVSGRVLPHATHNAALTNTLNAFSRARFK